MVSLAGGAPHTFMVFTGHKNLERIKSAKRLNSHQAHWTLFLAKSEFTILYGAGSKNSKADSLSLLYSPLKRNIWRMHSSTVPHCRGYNLGHQSSDKKHIRGENPGGEKYVPFHLSDKLIMWAHSSLAIGLPSTHRTTPEQILWGIHMLQYIQSFISSCSIYAQAKVPRRKTTPSAYATNTMVTHCYRLWHRFPLTAKQHRHHGDYWPFFKSPLSTSSRRPAVCLRKGQAYLQPCIQVLWHPSGHNDVPGSSRYISFIGTVHGLTLACFFYLVFASHIGFVCKLSQ